MSVVTIDRILQLVPDRILLAVGVLLLGTFLAYLTGRLNRKLLIRAGVPGAVEGTAFERSARSFGTSTVSILAQLSFWFIVGVTVLVALTIAEVQYTERFWEDVTELVPQLFIAIIVLIAGVLIGDKTALVISERLRGVKLPQVGIIPTMVKYSIIYIAVLIALSQIRIATNALLILLAIYFFGLVFLSGVAFKDLLTSGAAGMYLLYAQPYGIGDEIEIGDRRGIVQEVDMFVTRIENDDGEYIVPNNRIFEHGVVRMRSS